jgi:hypothetical protein
MDFPKKRAQKSATEQKAEQKTDLGADSKKSQGEQVQTESNNPLLDQVSHLVGLPTEWVESELSKLVSQSGHDLSNMTIEDLRAITLNYLNDMDFQFQEQQQSDLVFLENVSAKPQ